MLVILAFSRRSNLEKKFTAKFFKTRGITISFIYTKILNIQIFQTIPRFWNILPTQTCSELYGYNLARLEEKRIKSHKFRVGCVLFFPHPLFSISTFARLGSNPLHFTCPKISVSSLTCSRMIQSSEQPLLVSYSQAYKSDILTNNNSYI